LSLGTDAAQIPSVVVIREDGEVLVGDAAERRASAEPTRAAREFKRRLGDPVPIIIGDTTHSVESLMGHLLREIVRRATEQEGEAPTVVMLTHPANYSDYKIGSLREAARLAGLQADRVVLLTEPEAAAVSYTRQQRIEPGEIVAVYDFGGGTFDAALVRRTAERFELVGVPEGMERLGGIDFDQAVMAHVDSSLGGLVSGADRNDPQTRPGQARLRSECRRAKEALSTDSDTSIPVALPGVQTEVRLTRVEFESMIRPRIAETVRALERAVASAHVGMDQISRVLLVGGTSRMPIVAEMVREATGRPVSLDAHPKLAIAVGAALAGAAALPTEAAPMAPAAGAAAAAAGTALAPSAWQPPARVVEPAAPAVPPAAPARKGPKTGVLVAIIGGVFAVAALVTALALRGGSSNSKSNSSTQTTAVLLSVPTVSAAPSTTGPTATVAPTTVATAPSGRGVAALVSHAAFNPSAAPGSGIPGPAAAAGTAGIAAVAVDAKGAVYVATAESTVLKITGGQIALVATLDPADGVPGGIVVATDGSVLVSTKAGVRSLNNGASTLLLDAAAAGAGATPGPITLDGVGNLYAADNDGHRIIRRGTDGSLSLIAGNGTAATPGPLAAEGQPAGTAAIGTVAGLAIDAGGNLIVADSAALAIREISSAGTITTLAGGGATALGTAGEVVAESTPARSIAFATINGFAVNAAGRVYVADNTSGAIVRISSSGGIEAVITHRTDVTAADNVAARQSSITTVGAMAWDRAGSLYFADAGNLRKIAGL
jgi:hypothetical protein